MSDIKDGENEEDEEEECSTIAESTASVQEQHRLEERLRDLRHKKLGIDKLLTDLRALTASTQLLNNGLYLSKLLSLTEPAPT